MFLEIFATAILQTIDEMSSDNYNDAIDSNNFNNDIGFFSMLDEELYDEDSIY